MSDSASAHRSGGARQSGRAPRFEIREEPLRAPPQIFPKSADLVDDLPDLPPRPIRRLALADSLDADAFSDGMRLPPSRGPLHESAADLQRARVAAAQIEIGRAVFSFPTPRRSTGEVLQDHPWLFLVAGALCLGIILLATLASAPPRTVISRFGGLGNVTRNVVSQAPQRALPPVPPGQHTVLGEPTISAAYIDTVLAEYGSPAYGTGKVWVELGRRYGIDPAYALAFFIHESSAGTNPGWAGMKPGGGTTHNVGNIICAGYPTCFGRFRDYASWEEGIDDWYDLIATEYVAQRGAHTVEQIIPIYAPASDNNNVANYVNVVVTMVKQWHSQQAR